MCDTQVIRLQGSTLFAKNSDREPDEPQHIRYYPGVQGDTTRSVKTTYIEVDQVPDRHALILSQPAWLWGAEMGVNEHGLVIGNEAVFTRVVDRDGSALLGMDVLRLALERTRAARGAIQCIDNLLSEYGQGGPAGYRNKNFRYDSSFIIADPGEAWILETAGRHWVARRVDGFDAISNALCITDDFELHSEGLHEYARTHTRYRGPGELNFARAFDTFFMRFMGKPERRRACSLETLSSLSPPGLLALAAGLRRHDSDNGDFSRHDNADVCMHAGGLLRPSQTTGSMLVKLAPDTTPEVYVTGTSAPCLSLFQPLSFQACAEGAAPAIVYHPDGNQPSLWQQFEPVHHRALIDLPFRRALQGSRDELESILFEASRDVSARSERALAWHRHWQDECRSTGIAYNRFSAYHRFWHGMSTTGRL
ncbi:MAG: C69 family dipeptidase [Halieaceae bacterium]|nr:C69 family dipeptidase [Halieaceae bacterium]MCP5148480.1 C69 family dipeptidase [Pseudomonadales bacterium]MCP5195103.1 C69 family dipeptidase [Pseudomonadales bacterium]